MRYILFSINIERSMNLILLSVCVCLYTVSVPCVTNNRAVFVPSVVRVVNVGIYAVDTKYFVEKRYRREAQKPSRTFLTIHINMNMAPCVCA